MTTTVLLLLALSTVVLGSSEPQQEALMFNQADKDQDGQLSADDLHQIFLDFDVNMDGTITKAEFINDWTHLLNLGNADQAQRLFASADVDHDGAITDLDLPSIFSYFDMDGNNLVNMNEFLTQWGDLKLEAPDTVTVVIDTHT